MTSMDNNLYKLHDCDTANGYSLLAIEQYFELLKSRQMMGWSTSQISIKGVWKKGCEVEHKTGYCMVFLYILFWRALLAKI